MITFNEGDIMGLSLSCPVCGTIIESKIKVGDLLHELPAQLTNGLHEIPGNRVTCKSCEYDLKTVAEVKKCIRLELVD